MKARNILPFLLFDLHSELDEDMLSIKELNAEIFRIIRKENSGEAKPDLIQLSFKTNRLLKKILLRRFQLEQEAQFIRKMSDKVAGGEESEDVNADIDSPKDGIDQVINKLKTMIQDIDTGDNTGGVNTVVVVVVVVVVVLIVFLCN